MPKRQNDQHLVDAIKDRYEAHADSVMQLVQEAERRGEDLTEDDMSKIKADMDAMLVEAKALAEQITNPHAKAQLNEMLANWPKFDEIEETGSPSEGAATDDEDATYQLRQEDDGETVTVLDPNGDELGRVLRSKSTDELVEHLRNPLPDPEGYKVSQSGMGMKIGGEFVEEQQDTADLIAPNGQLLAEARNWEDGMSILTHLNRHHNNA